jgi:hypothetical protein
MLDADPSASPVARFLALIRDPHIRPLFEEWNRARGAKATPRWSDLDPSAMKPALPYIWSWWRDGDGEYFIRLAGENVVQTLGFSMRGQSLRKLFPEAVAQLAIDRYDRVLGEPALCHMRGSIFSDDQRRGEGERIILPLAADRRGEGVIGATIYEFAQLWRGPVVSMSYDAATFISLASADPGTP